MKNNKNIISSMLLAFSFLTILPIKFRNKINETEIKDSIIFYPVVGLFFGILLFFISSLFSIFKISSLFTAFAVLALPYFLNKFLHFDGLCDTADAFLSDRTPAERLVILKDSRIGSFAFGFVSLFLILKFIVLKELVEITFLQPLLILFPVYSRFGIIFLSKISVYPREKGTAQFIVGKIDSSIFQNSGITFFIILSTFFMVFWLKYFIFIIILLFISFVFLFLFKVYSNKKINGITGDVLGASIEFLELILPLCTLFCYKVFYF